nr:M20/M25/M40 family metallo-hydrolase [Enterovibrio nigricans]
MIIQTLTSFGLAPVSGVGGYGVVVRFDSVDDGPHLLFRADIDALPIHENPSHEHGSTVRGVMHACGHDGHSASLMALAYKLSLTKLQRGSVTLIFQPVRGKWSRCARHDEGQFLANDTVRLCLWLP